MIVNTSPRNILCILALLFAVISLFGIPYMLNIAVLLLAIANFIP